MGVPGHSSRSPHYQSKPNNPERGKRFALTPTAHDARADRSVKSDDDRHFTTDFTLTAAGVVCVIVVDSFVGDNVLVLVAFVVVVFVVIICSSCAYSIGLHWMYANQETKRQEEKTRLEGH